VEPWRRGPRPGADFRLARVRVEATSPDRALARLVADLGLEAAAVADPPFLSVAPGLPLEAVAAAEKILVEQGAVVPLIHLPVSYAVTARLDAWLGPVVSALGHLNLGAAWLRPETP
jgi:hypothetical protein